MDNLVREISTLLSKPVDLPCENPTKAYWQHPPHDIAQHQSHELPSSCDFLVIGSGMTGLAAAKYLLETNDEARIVVLEARAICSGATGRNGGHLKSSAVLDFAANTERFGEEQARKIQAYQSMTCARVRQVAEQYCAMESEIRQVNSIGVFEDSELMKHALCTIDQFRGGENKDSTDYGVVNAQEYGIHGAVGAISSSAGAMWPYRLVTNVWEALLKAHPTRLFLEAFTPATCVKIAHSESKNGNLLVATLRGNIEAARVLHCTNGFSAQLIPKLAGKIFPVRGTMTVQQPPEGFSNDGADRSWAFLRRPVYDCKTRLFNPGLEYLTQNAKSGLFFFGGEKTTLKDTFNTDDTCLTESSKTYLHDKLGESFGTKKMSLVSAWSGIMGFTGDGLPLIGKLPPSLIDADSDNQFIAAGFNGYGMPTCWLAGEAIAQLALGHKMPAHVPEPYIVTEQRLAQLTSETAALGMLGEASVINV